MTHKIINNTVPEYLSDLIKLRLVIHVHSFYHCSLRVPQLVKVVYFYVACDIWKKALLQSFFY